MSYSLLIICNFVSCSKLERSSWQPPRDLLLYDKKCYIAINMPQKAKILPKSQRCTQNEAVYIENMHGMQTTHVYTYAGDNR